MRWLRLLPVLVLAACGGEDEPDGDGSDPSESSDPVARVSDSDLWFEDATAALGLGPERALGVAIVDYTGDGWSDVVVAAMGGIKIYRNRGDGSFEDDGVRSRIAEWDAKTVIGLTFGDVDGDGDLDMFATVLTDHDLLYQNDGTGVFTDVTSAAGLTRIAVSQGAVFGDFDGDDDLDIFVAALPWKEGDTDFPPTDDMKAAKNIYWRNDGTGHFTDATDEAGLAGLAEGLTFGAIALDVDGDADLDLLVINDAERDQLYLNDGKGSFTDEGPSWLGVEFTGRMGMAVGDLNGDGELDIYATNWHSDLLVTTGGPGASAILADVFDTYIGDGYDNSALTTGWGCAVFDMDNDGDQDVITTSSYTDGYGIPEEEGPPREGQLVLLENRGNGDPDGALVYANDRAGSPLQLYMNGFGLAVGDLDGDGDLDVIVGVDRETKLRGQDITGDEIRLGSLLLRNEGRRAHTNRSIVLSLRQPTGKNRFAVGARVDIEVEGKRTSRVILAGSSYLSFNSPDLHFGLGGSPVAERLRVTWPDGAVQTFLGWPAGYHVLERPEGGACCTWGGAGCQDLETCEYTPPGADGDPAFCDTVCARLSACDLSRIGLPVGDAEACLEECKKEPLKSDEQACFDAAEGCAQMFSCLGVE